MKKYLSLIFSLVIASAILSGGCKKPTDKILDSKNGKWKSKITTQEFKNVVKTAKTYENGTIIFKENTFQYEIKKGDTKTGTWYIADNHIYLVFEHETQKWEILDSKKDKQIWERKVTLETADLYYYWSTWELTK